MRWLACVQELNRAGGVGLRGLSVLRRFVPCWAIREQVENGTGMDGEPEAAETLERVDRAYAGSAPGTCRTCGVYRAAFTDTKEALSARTARTRSRP